MFNQVTPYYIWKVTCMHLISWKDLIIDGKPEDNAASLSCSCINQSLWVKCLYNDGQQFYQYQQNKHTPVTVNH